jgi:hypothetical protein
VEVSSKEVEVFQVYLSFCVCVLRTLLISRLVCNPRNLVASQGNMIVVTFKSVMISSRHSQFQH